jgi:hypothetical protein
MNPPPVPFGDPDQIQRANNRAIKQGVFFGCGGCGLLTLLAIGGFVGLFVFIFFSVRGSEPFQHTLLAAQRSPELTAAIGQPITLGWYFTGSVNWNNGDGDIRATIPVNGPNGSASISVVGTQKAGHPWVFEEMIARVKTTNQLIDMNQALPAEAEP